MCVQLLFRLSKLPAFFLAAGGVVILAGCAGEQLPAGNHFVVSSTSAEFYKNGPAQEVGFDVDLSGRKFAAPDYGADFSLPKGAAVTLVQRESGYSRVATEGGIVGYVANDQLQPAPPLPVTLTRVSHPVRRDRQPSPNRRSPTPAAAPDSGLDMRDLPLPLPE